MRPETQSMCVYVVLPWVVVCSCPCVLLVCAVLGLCCLISSLGQAFLAWLGWLCLPSLSVTIHIHIVRTIVII
jgi:hypothetical protein